MCVYCNKCFSYIAPNTAFLTANQLHIQAITIDDQAKSSLGSIPNVFFFQTTTPNRAYSMQFNRATHDHHQISLSYQSDTEETKNQQHARDSTRLFSPHQETT